MDICSQHKKVWNQFPNTRVKGQLIFISSPFSIEDGNGQTADQILYCVMAEEGGNSKPQITYEYDLDAKWDACLDLSLRRIVYSSLAGALGSLVFFRKSHPIIIYSHCYT